MIDLLWNGSCFPINHLSQQHEEDHLTCWVRTQMSIRKTLRWLRYWQSLLCYLSRMSSDKSRSRGNGWLCLRLLRQSWMGYLTFCINGTTVFKRSDSSFEATCTGDYFVTSKIDIFKWQLRQHVKHIGHLLKDYSFCFQV